MPRKAEPITVRELKTMRRKAEADPSYQEKRADGGQDGLYAWARRGAVDFWYRERGPGRTWARVGTFGSLTLDQARGIAQDWHGIDASGRSVAAVRAERDRAAVTVGDLIDAYLKDLQARAETGARKGRRSTHAEFARMLRRPELASLRKLQAGDVTRENVRAAHRALADRPAAANRTLTALGAAFAFGIGEGLASTNPCDSIGKLEEKGGRRALTRGELKSLGAALDATENPRLVLLVRLLALTGLRRGEVIGHVHRERGEGGGLRWRDVDLEAGIVTLRDSKTGPQRRVIGQAAVDLLREAKPENATATAYVIPGQTPGQPYRAVNNTRRRLWKRAGLPFVDESGQRLDLHSLRHSFASIGAHAQDGRYAGLVSALLGHGHQGRAVTERYITADPEALRPAADAVAKKVAALLGLTKRADVVPIRREASA